MIDSFLPAGTMVQDIHSGNYYLTSAVFHPEHSPSSFVTTNTVSDVVDPSVAKPYSAWLHNSKNLEVVPKEEAELIMTRERLLIS